MQQNLSYFIMEEKSNGLDAWRGASGKTRRRR